MIMVCVMAVSMTMPVSAADGCTHGVCFDAITYDKSWITDHMNGTCSIYKVYRIVDVKCIFCGYTVLTSITHIGDEHSLSHP
jgi:hypothetical protein